MELADLNWTKLGADLRSAARDAHEGNLPSIEIAYDFMLSYPECFIDAEEWPAGMPQEANIELIAAYLGATA